MFRRVIHPKVRWATYASAAAAVLTALAGSLGASTPPVVVSILTGLAAALAGYRAPSEDKQDPDA